MTAAKNLTNDLNNTLQAFDEHFFELFANLSRDCINKAASCTEQVFEVSKQYLDQDATTLLKQFYDLYFATSTVENRKEQINKNVDDIFDQVQENLQKGRDLDEGVEISSADEQERLGLAGLQKKLEGLISMDEAIRQTLIPTLASMQFEDAVRQRLDHINSTWSQLLSTFHQAGPRDFDQLGRTMANVCTSSDETALFYRIILNEEPPEGAMDQGEALLF